MGNPKKNDGKQLYLPIFFHEENRKLEQILVKTFLLFFPKASLRAHPPLESPASITSLSCLSDHVNRMIPIALMQRNLFNFNPVFLSQYSLPHFKLKKIPNKIISLRISPTLESGLERSETSLQLNFLDETAVSQMYCHLNTTRLSCDSLI